MTSKSVLSRRLFLRGTAAGAASLGLAACGGSDSASNSSVAGGSGADAAAAGDWKQFAGTTINFISENTAPSAAIAANIAPFENLTGIKVNITQMELSKLVERVQLDFSSGSAQYHVIYADPYQVLAPFSDGLVDLNEFISDAQYPPLELGVGDFIPTQLGADGHFLDNEKIFALPYDAPTMIWQYRLDLFEKYHTQMTSDLGFDPTPSPKITWDQYYEIANWFNKNAKSDVAYGTGQQAKQYDSLQCDFSNLLWAYGGDYFAGGADLGTIGTEDPGSCTLTSDASIAAAQMYKKLVSIAHPSSTTWDWGGLGDAFAAGSLAMCANWHEFAAGNEKALPGKVGYSALPTGPARSANIFGGTGIGVNANAQDAERGAAWLFTNWATSPATQLSSLASSVGGGTPTRQSVYELPEVMAATKRPSEFPNILAADAVQVAWQPDYIGLRPKIATWAQVDTIVYTELSKMLTSDLDEAATLQTIASQVDQVR